MFLWSMSGLKQKNPPGCSSALVVAATNLNMLLTVVSEPNVVRYLLYLQQQSVYGNFSYAASPKLRDVSVVQQKTACPTTTLHWTG